ncbi:MAG: preprotein translocase subunit SecY [Bacteroidota bacterium]|jgi:preprotein translocase subunit SecY
MKKFLDTVRNIFSIEDLRVRIFNTLGYLLIFRLGSYIVLPGVDATKLESSAKGIFGLIDTFLGGAFSNASILALGIMPYISASIIIQLLTVAFPYFQKLQKDGEAGRKKLNQLTRVFTILITIGQSIGYVSATIKTEALLMDRTLVTVSSVFILTAGTMFCMWLGEKITEKGIGNGISMLIMIGIISRFPGAIISEGTARGMNGVIFFIAELFALFFVIIFVIALTQATRKIPVQYAKQVVGNKVFGGQRQYLPVKLNTAGVMPIIFAQSILFLPSMLAGFFADNSDFASSIVSSFSDATSWQYNLSSATLIIVFTFFYTAISINPTQIADDMKRNNGFIPSVKPGPETAEFIDDVISKITLPGAILLAAVAILPAFASIVGIDKNFSLFYGGTSLIIMVGVVLDTLQQVESHLLLKKYDGLMTSGRVNGSTEALEIA